MITDQNISSHPKNSVYYGQPQDQGPIWEKCWLLANVIFLVCKSILLILKYNVSEDIIFYIWIHLYKRTIFKVIMNGLSIKWLTENLKRHKKRAGTWNRQFSVACKACSPSLSPRPVVSARCPHTGPVWVCNEIRFLLALLLRLLLCHLRMPIGGGLGFKEVCV